MDIVTPNLAPGRTYIVRLRDGVPVVDAERRLTAAVRAVASSLLDAWQGVRLESLHARYTRDMRPVLVAIATAAVLVLLLVCANVAVLMLLRALRRRTEMAVRVALGAGVAHLLRLVAIESALICGVALVAALLVSAIAMQLIAPAVETALGQPVPHGLAAMRIDPNVATIVLTVSVGATVLLSAVPLLAPWQRRLSQTLRGGSRAATDAGVMRRVRAGLVVAQLAVSVALAVGCGLTIRSALHLVRTDLGIATDGVFRVRVVPSRRGYEDHDTRLQFYQTLLATIQARSSEPLALSSFPMLLPTAPVTVEVADSPGVVTTSSIAVTGSVFSILGMRIVQGRNFTDADAAASEPVAIVSETFARRAFPAAAALGQAIRTMDEAQGPAAGAWRTIVGVVSDVRQARTDDDLADVYLPFLQQAGLFTSVYVRHGAAFGSWLENMGAAVREIDPRVFVRASGSLAVEAEGQLAGPRFLASVLTGFALVAACIAMLGIYAVVAYAVQQRIREVAIRAALGATPRLVTEMLLRQSAPVVALGCACGALGALVVSHVLKSQLHGVEPFDLPTVVAGCVVIGAGAMLFVWSPARRAAAIGPSIALNET